MEQDIILETHNLRKDFGGLVAVADVSMKVKAHTLHSIIGPNGAGKTTFFNLLSGNLEPTSGRVIFKGRDITALPAHRTAHLGIGRSFLSTPPVGFFTGDLLHQVPSTQTGGLLGFFNENGFIEAFS